MNFEETTFYSYWLDEKALALALLKTRFPNLICITRAHGWDVYHERHIENYLPFRSFILNKVNATFTISNNGKDYASKKYPQFQGKIKVSRLGTLALSSISQKKENNFFHFLSISSIIRLKRVGKILEVVSELSNKKIHWTHIGEGPLMKQVQTEAKKREQENPNFSFELMGNKINTEVRDFLATNYIDLFINLSETEGIPVSIMEAQSAGIPVLATNVGGTSEIVNNENGVLVDKDFNQEDVVYIIQKYLSSTEEEKQLKRKASYKNWKKHYNAETNYKEFVKLLTT